MKRIIGSIFVCLILATSAMANETLIWPRTANEPFPSNPEIVLAQGKILSTQLDGNRTDRYVTVVKFIVAFDDLIYMCRHIDYRGGDNSDIYCVKSRSVTN